jgi:hypothetical protein
MGAVAAIVVGWSVDGGPPSRVTAARSGSLAAVGQRRHRGELGERMRNADTALKPGR